MARNKLRKLKIDRVDLVDRGANPFSHILIAKADDGELTGRIAELEDRLEAAEQRARVDREVAKNLVAPTELSAQARGAARNVARSNFRSDPATRGELDRISTQEEITQHKAFGDIIAGRHSDDLQAHAARHVAVAEQAAKDALSLPAEGVLDDLQKMQEAMQLDLAEIAKQDEILTNFGADALASFHALGFAREEVNTRIRKLRQDRPHLTWESARDELDASDDQEWARLRRREASAQTAHREGLAKGQSMNMQRRVRAATSVYSDMQAAAHAEFPEIGNPVAAMNAYMALPQGAAHYQAYVQAGREQAQQ